MANILADVLGGGLDLIPHIEAAALQYITRSYAIYPRVRMFNDMQGFNTRKVSEYLLPRTAQEIDEATDIPDTKLLRKRRSEITIKEVGERYKITDRRIQTDLEDIVADVAMALGKSIGDRYEIDLIDTMLASVLPGYSFGSAGSAFDIANLVQAQYEFSKRRGNAATSMIHAALHPFHSLDVMSGLIEYSGSNAGADLDFRNQAIRTWRVPTFNNIEAFESSWLPRNVVWRVRTDGTGGTFRLSVAGLTTGAITVSATPATMATNIKNALDALSIGTWTVGSAALDDLVVTSPASLYVHADEELAVAVDPANPTLEGQKSAYDLVTGGSGTFGADLDGEDYGVVVQEKSASAKSILFYRDFVAMDMRQAPTGHVEMDTNQGRTWEYSLYSKYGTGYWNPVLGMTIVADATSPLAVASV